MAFDKFVFQPPGHPARRVTVQTLYGTVMFEVNPGKSDNKRHLWVRMTPQETEDFARALLKAAEEV